MAHELGHDVTETRMRAYVEEFTAWRATGADAIKLDLTIGDHTVVVRTGYHGRGVEVARTRTTAAPTVVSGSPAAPSPAAIAAAASCRCC